MTKIFFLSFTLLNLIYSTIFSVEFTSNNGYNNSNFETNGESFFLTTTIAKLENPVIFDVGANIGEWSLLTFSINDSAKIFSFEPNPETYEELLNNITSFQNITAYKLAFSNEKAKDREFYTYKNVAKLLNYNYNTHSLDSLYNRRALKRLFRKECKRKQIDLSTLDEVCTTIHVSLNTIDEFLEGSDIEKIDLLKIDTEGEEYNILCGAKKTLSQGIISKIQFEYGGCYIDANTKLKDVYHLLTSFGYKIYRLLPEDKIEITIWDPSLENYQYSNYVAFL